MKIGKFWRNVRWLLLISWLATGLWQTHKPMPAGTHISTAPVVLAEQDVRFLFDLTYRTGADEPVYEQRIFDAAFAMIDSAQRFMVLDFFLFNDAMGDAAHRRLSRELADRLLARKRTRPELHILLITDPINDVYGGNPSALLAELRGAGIDVVPTALPALRDSNPAYSAVWRGLLQWWGNSPGGWLPDPFDRKGPAVSLRSWLALLNFKANHRKVLVADDAAGQWSALITSANPHDASSSHSNVAVIVKGRLAKDILDSELGVARFSDWVEYFDTGTAPVETPVDRGVEAVYVTEGAIRERLLRAIDATRQGDAIGMAMFYLADRDIVEALLAAAARGAQARLILDPNRDAFGLDKNGIPNRPVANELVRKSQGAIQVRWYRTHGEQFHTKLTFIRRADRFAASLGSANLTRRNIGDYNLEANVQLLTSTETPLARDITTYFERLWSGTSPDGAEYTAPFEIWRDESQFRYWLYRFMEATGFSTF